MKQLLAPVEELDGLFPMAEVRRIDLKLDEEKE